MLTVIVAANGIHHLRYSYARDVILIRTRTSAELMNNSHTKAMSSISFYFLIFFTFPEKVSEVNGRVQGCEIRVVVARSHGAQPQNIAPGSLRKKI